MGILFIFIKVFLCIFMWNIELFLDIIVVLVIDDFFNLEEK